MLFGRNRSIHNVSWPSFKRLLRGQYQKLHKGSEGTLFWQSRVIGIPLDAQLSRFVDAATAGLFHSSRLRKKASRPLLLC